MSKNILISLFIATLFGCGHAMRDKNLVNDTLIREQEKSDIYFFMKAAISN